MSAKQISWHEKSTNEATSLRHFLESDRRAWSGIRELHRVVRIESVPCFFNELEEIKGSCLVILKPHKTEHCTWSEACADLVDGWLADQDNRADGCGVWCWVSAVAYCCDNGRPAAEDRFRREFLKGGK